MEINRYNAYLKLGWKSFLFSLLVWYAFLSLYMTLGTSQWSIATKYWFYTRYSWPNFLLSYFTAIFLIPYLLHPKKYLLFIISLISVLMIYTVIRYYNHILQDDDMYSYMKKVGNEMVLMRLDRSEIAKGEIIKGIQFVLIGFSYRFIFDRIILDRKINSLEKEKILADLTMLRYQLNPHFLFNTINDIYYLALIRSNNTADALLELSDLLRYVLQEKEQRVALKKEIEHLQRFVKLHHFRFPESTVDLQIDIHENAESLEIAPLMLISFTENAFKHGEQGTEEEPVRISLSVAGSTLSYKVVNVVGEQTSKDKSNGIGLTNLKKRLELMYPGQFTMSAEKKGNHFIAKLDISLTKI
jgi:two-component system LytT family sensor kinase